MNDEKQTATRLRERLDRELARVRATGEAEERLDLRMATSTSDQRRGWTVGRLSIVTTLICVSVIVAVTAVTLLFRESRPSPSTADPDPLGLATTPSVGPSPRPAPMTPAAPPTDSPDLWTKIAPETVVIGARVTLTMAGSRERFVDLSVNWDDGTRPTVVPGDCSADSTAFLGESSPLTHFYARPGTDEVPLAIAPCDESSPHRVVGSHMVVSVSRPGGVAEANHGKTTIL